MRLVLAPAPPFRRVAAGDYETPNGRFRLYRLIDVRPPAWNVEVIQRESGYVNLIIDGAATKQDAEALFARWWASL